MFFIFKILPDWLWWFILLAGLISFFASYLPQLKTYEIVLKGFSLVAIPATIFTLGLLHADNTWKAAAAELEAKVAIAAEQSNTVNEVVKQKVITKTEVVKVRGEDIIKYVDREVVKYDSTCVIPPVFIESHNRAAEQPK